MASVSIKYGCGCGYRTDKLEEAIKHSDQDNHSLTVLGTITKDNK